MRVLDTYILRFLAGAFGFFLLIFTGVVWLTQAVRLIDTVLASGQSAQVFVTFSLLVMPSVLVVVLPLAAIGGTLYALNRLYSDSELTVMMMAGLGPAGLIRALGLFGLLVGASVAFVMQVLVPLAGASLAERTRAIRSDLANALIVDGQFVHPVSGLTIFVHDASREGEMAGLFLNDQRDAARPVTYSAERARFLRQGDQARLVMLDGVALSAEPGGPLSTVVFDRFIYDLTDLVEEDGAREPRPSEYPVPALLDPSDEMLASGRHSRGKFISEGHYKIVYPLMAALLPVIALLTFLAGGNRRSGVSRRVFVAIGVAVAMQILLFLGRARAEEAPQLWPLIYMPVAFGLIYCAGLLHWLGRERRRMVRA